MNTINVDKSKVTVKNMILAHFNFNGKDYISFIELSNGNRWRDPIEVVDLYAVTREELAKAFTDIDKIMVDGELFFKEQIVEFQHGANKVILRKDGSVTYGCSTLGNEIVNEIISKRQKLLVE